MQPISAFVALTIIQLSSFGPSLLLAGGQHQNEKDQSCELVQEEANCDEKQEHQQQDDGCFRAAVFEHYRKNLSNMKDLAADSLSVYAQVAQLSSQNGANIVVFPEDGIFFGTKQEVLPALSEIPDPETLTSANNNPCLQPDLYESSDILRNLSCVARENNLYVVANFGTKQTCQPGEKVGDQICPQIGHFALNTDVVLDSRGNYIKRYRKFNLFVEIFDKSPTLETTYFDTPFGRFGVFTCFDMMFKRPAVELVEELHIDTAIFPTWWYDELPLLSAIQFQEGWSWTHRVNLLASNVHMLNLGSVGSGIFSGLQSVYTTVAAKQPRLVIANLPKKFSLTSQCSQQFEPLILDIETSEPKLEYTYKQYTLLPTDSIYKLDDRKEGKKTICSGQVCCTINYEIASSSNQDHSGRLVLIARDGRRPGIFNWYEQVCVLASVEKPIDSKKLDQVRYSTEAITQFDKLSLRGTFNSKYVYPITAHNVSELVNRNEREFSCERLGRKQDNLMSCRLNYIGGTKKELYSFGMYGRLYDKDKMPAGW